jgi:hypothetical protein
MARADKDDERREVKRPPGQPAASPQPPSPDKDSQGEQLPCRSSNRAWWKYVLLALIFLAWLAFLIYCAVV